MALSEDFDRFKSLLRRMVDKAGRPDTARDWLTRWQEQPVPALRGLRPVDVLKELGGLEQVQRILSYMQSGVST